jgi:hypothetical protein
MEKTDIKIRFFLREESRTISRNLKAQNRLPGTRQLECYITFGRQELTTLPDGKPWEKHGDYKGSAVLGWSGTAMTTEAKQKVINVKKRLGKYRINKSGALIEYLTAKIQTGLYILPDAWESKNQISTGVYEPINKLLNQWRHVIKLTYSELIKLTDFTKEKLVRTVRDRLKNGVPIQVIIPATASPMEAMSRVAKTMDGKNIIDISNRHNVPTDLREFIPFYAKNKLIKKKLSDETEETRNELVGKLNRYFRQTGKVLSITESTIIDVSDFFAWRIHDNEINSSRKGNRENPTRPEAIGVGTFNKCKKLVRFFFDKAVDNFECHLQFSTAHVIFKEVPYDRELNDVYLSMAQIREIMALNITDKTLNAHRSLFLIGCLGGGYRVEDLHRIDKPLKEDFQNGEYYTFNVTSNKTNARTKVPIPHFLDPYVESYDFSVHANVHELRKSIKEIGKLCGWYHDYKYNEQLADGTSKPVVKKYWDMLQPKTCRKTFCSLLYNYYGFTIEEAGAYSGHSSDEFKKYLQVDKKAKAQQLVDKFEFKLKNEM